MQKTKSGIFIEPWGPNEPVEYRHGGQTIRMEGVCRFCRDQCSLTPRCAHGFEIIPASSRPESPDYLLRVCAGIWNLAAHGTPATGPGYLAAIKSVVSQIDRNHPDEEGSTIDPEWIRHMNDGAAWLIFEYLYAPPLRIRFSMLCPLVNPESGQRSRPVCSFPLTRIAAADKECGHTFELSVSGVRDWVAMNRIAVPDNRGGIEFLAMLLKSPYWGPGQLNALLQELPSLSFRLVSPSADPAPDSSVYQIDTQTTDCLWTSLAKRPQDQTTWELYDRAYVETVYHCVAKWSGCIEAIGVTQQSGIPLSDSAIGALFKSPNPYVRELLHEGCAMYPGGMRLARAWEIVGRRDRQHALKAPLTRRLPEKRSPASGGSAAVNLDEFQADHAASSLRQYITTNDIRPRPTDTLCERASRRLRHSLLSCAIL